MTRVLATLNLVAMTVIGGAASAADRTVTLAVANMYCTACPYIVKQSLAKVSGVANVAVSFGQKTATVTYDDEKTTTDALISATTLAGYPSKAIP